MGEGAVESFDPTKNHQEVGSVWLVVSGPAGSKVVETFDGGGDDARGYAKEMIARGVEAEVREMVALSFHSAVRVDVERSGCKDATLLYQLLAKALLRAADGMIGGALVSRESTAETSTPTAPKIVVPTLSVRPRPGRGRRGR